MGEATESTSVANVGAFAKKTNQESRKLGIRGKKTYEPVAPLRSSCFALVASWFPNSIVQKRFNDLKIILYL